MYNKLREKVNLLLEDTESKLCPSCHELIDNCNCETTQEDSSSINYYTSDEGYNTVAEQILKYQKKLGKLRSVEVRVLSLSESRKRRLKSAGIFVGANVASIALLAGVSYGASNHVLNKYRNTVPDDRLNSIKKYNRNELLKGVGASAGTLVGLTGAGTAITKNLLEVVAVCDYQYGKKMIDLLSVNKDADTKKVSKEINKNINAALKTVEKQKEWKIKEDCTPIQSATSQLSDLLIENVLNY